MYNLTKSIIEYIVNFAQSYLFLGDKTMENQTIQVKNVQRAMTFDRFLYAILEEEADKLGVKISHLVNQEMCKVYQDRIQLLKQQERNKQKK